ncbi:uncharacterized protein [Watersipora subatra]|uniref:uncharacterized protein n=1 Tax=Watersipora subatra TaxID=2589382 RepID=UPI00355C6F18
MSLLSTLIVLAAASLLTIADFEHFCTTNDYYYGSQSYNQYQLCGSNLAEYIFDRCAGMLFVGVEAPKPRKKRSKSGTFLEEKRANSFLRTKRSLSVGIVCECCIFRCSVIELDQYCSSKRRRRSTMASSKKDPRAPVTLNKFYEQLGSRTVTANISSNESEKIEWLEANKRRNIAMRQIHPLPTQKMSKSEATQISSNRVANSPPKKVSGLGMIVALSLRVPTQAPYRSLLPDTTSAN